jgi:intracellular septation protein
MKFLADFFPVLLFFVAYQLFGIYVATATAIVAAAVQVAYLWFRHRKVEKMQWITLGLLTVFGGMTLLLHDPLFIKWKPTVVNWLFAAAFLGSALFRGPTLIQRMMGQAMELPSAVWSRLNLAWGIFFLLLGLANLHVAFTYSEELWVNFKLFGMLGLTLLFVIAQSFYLARYLPEDPGIGEKH